MDLSFNPVETFASAFGMDDELNMLGNVLDSPLVQLMGTAAPFLAPICPPLALACGTIATAAQTAQQLGLGNDDEKAKQSAKSGEPTQLMAKSEDVAPRSAERRETAGRERSETVSERHREPPVRDHRTDREAGDHRPVRDHRTERDVRDHRTGSDERRVPVRRDSGDDSFKIQPGDSFLLILAKAFADDIKQKQDEIETDATNAKDSADNSLVAAKTQEFAQLVQLTNTVIQTVGGAEKTAAGQPA
jgi:hypothetical protein